MNMMTPKKEASVSDYWSYAFMGFLHLVFLRFLPGQWVPLSKVMLMPLLILAVYRQTTAGERQTSGVRILIGALFLSGLGDTLPIGKDEGYFVGGLTAFLCANLLYIVLFVKAHRRHSGGVASTWIDQRAWPAVLIPLSLLYVLYSGLGELILPVVVYMAVITLMWLLALSNYIRKRNTHSGGEGWGSATLLALGATLFVASDATLACDKFMAPFPGAQLTVMGTYILAQLAMVRGFLGVAELRNQN